jgi:hypothetical protein
MTIVTQSEGIFACMLNSGAKDGEINVRRYLFFLQRSPG